MTGIGTRSNADGDAWPELPRLDTWEETRAAVHLWSQIVGKIRLQLAPWVNHSWGSTLYITPRGLTTSPIHHRGELFQIDLDFRSHALRIETSGGRSWGMGLGPMSVASFYREFFGGLQDLAIDVRILARPVELEVVVPFEEDTRERPYDGDAIQRFWRALVQVDRVLKAFRARFRGKSSPVHFFWGSFDLAVTRFSGRPAPSHPGGAPNLADWVMREAYSHEVASSGFWAGNGLGEAAFYAYAYPEPDGYRKRAVLPEAAYFHDALGEFILPYEAVRTSPDPDAALTAFLQSTYATAAELGAWDRAELEWTVPVVGSGRADDSDERPSA